MNRKIYTIEEASQRLSDIMGQHNVRRLMVVHGKKSYFDCGGNDLMSRLYDLHNMEVYNFDDFSANPNIEDASKGAELLRVTKPDAIIAIGGGSAMDIAKLMRYMAEQTDKPLIAIPTTAGTGAESTQFAVCYVDGKKESIDRTDLLPDYAILVPSLTMRNNAYLTACTGFDALAQAIESYWNIYATPESEVYSEQAIGLLYRAMNQYAIDQKACLSDYDWREQMMQGAYWAGKAINLTRTTAPHAMSYVLTSQYGYPHGHAVALTFPYFFEKNVRCRREDFAGENYDEYRARMQRMLRMLGINWNDDLFIHMKQFINSLGLGYDADRSINIDVVAKSVNVNRAKNNPCMLTEDILRQAAQTILQ